MRRHSVPVLGLFCLASSFAAESLRAQTREVQGQRPSGPSVTPLTISSAVKTVTDLNGGTVLAGDTLVYDITVTNNGAGKALIVGLVDTIPSNTTYAANSLRITAGPNSGNKTDAIGDDQGFYELLSRPRVRFRLGSGATGTTNGTLQPSQSTSVQFRVVVSATAATRTVIANRAQVNYFDEAVNDESVALSAPPGGVAGTPTTVTVENPDLTITKSHVGNFVRGSAGTYTLTPSNLGPGTSDGVVTITDVVPTGLTPTSATGSGWTCSITGQTVTCTRTTPLGVGAAPAITLTVDVLTTAPNTLTNTATIAGGGDQNAANNRASDPTNIVSPSAPDLAIVKRHSGDFVARRTGTYSLAVSNAGTIIATGPVVVTDTLPLGLSWRSATGGGWSCSAQGQVVTCNNPGPLGLGASTTISLTIDVLDAAYPQVTNRAWVAAPGDVNTANNVSTDPTNVLSIPDFAITKTTGPTLTVGTNATYTIGVANLSPGSSSALAFVTDTLPAGLTYVSASGGQWSCANAGQVLRCTHPIGVPAGASIPITLTVAVNASAVPSVTNRAHIESDGDVNTGNNSATVTTPVGPAPAPDLAIVKSHVGNFAAMSPQFFTITVTNVGNATANGPILVEDIVPSGLSFPRATGAGWTCTAGVIRCTHPGPLAPGESSTIRLDVVVEPSAYPAVTNTAIVTAPGDNNPTNNTSIDHVIVESIPDFAIGKTAVGPFVVGSNATYTIGLTNISKGASFNVLIVTDVLPAGLTFVSATGPSWTCGQKQFFPQEVVCTHPAGIAAGASTAITLTVAVGPAAFPSVTNTVSHVNDTDVNFSNNTATITTPVTLPGAPDLALTKSTVGTFVAGQNGTYGLAVTNSGAGPTTGAITITDQLPNGLTFVSASGTGWTCGAVGQNVTCTNAGPLAAGGTSSVALIVAIANAAVPSVTNSATVSTPGDTNAGNNTGSVTTPVSPASVLDLTIAKTHTGSFVVGQNGLYTLSVSNIGTLPTTGVITVADLLPAGLTFLSGSGTGWTCSASGQNVSCTNAGPLTAGASTSIALTVGVGAAAVPSVTNTAVVSTPGETNLTNNSASDPTTVLDAPDLALVKSATSAFTVGQNATYQLQVTNVSTGPTTGTISITDVLPTGLTFVSGTGTNWTCGNAGQTVTCTYSGVLSGAAMTSVALTVSVGAPAAPSVTNSATVTTPGDAQAGNNTSAVTTPVGQAPAPDVSISKTHAGNFAALSPATYTLRVANIGSAVANGPLVVTDTLPASLTAPVASGAGWTCSTTGQVVQCTNPGPLNIGASSDITLTVSVGASAYPSVTNRAWVSAPGDVNPANNSSTDVATVVSIPDFAISKTAIGAFAVGSNATYSLGVTNVSPGPSSAIVTVTDTLPAGLTFVSATGGSWSCNNTGQIVTCTHPAGVGAGVTLPITLTVAVGPAAAPSVTNRGHVASLGDVNAGNNTASVTTPVTTPSVIDLRIAKSHAGNFVVGQNGVYAVTVTNAGNAPTTGAVSVTDQLPAGLSFVSGTGTGWTCAAVGQTVTCTSTSVLGAGATSAITLTVGVAAAALPSVINTATVNTPGDNNPANNTAADPTAVVSIPDLALAKTATGTFAVGQNASYQLVVTNVSPGPTTGAISITDVLPAGLSFVAATGSTWTCSNAGQTVTCVSPGPLAAGASSTVTLTVAVATPAAPSVTNSATVTTPGDANPANNTGTAVTPVVGLAPDLAIVKALVGTMTAGQRATYALTVSNPSAAPTTGTTTVTDVLPAGLTFVSASGGGFVCSAAGQTVTCAHPAVIAAGQSVAITMTVSAVAGLSGPVTNSASVSTSGDTNPANNTSSVTHAVATGIDLAIAKSSGALQVGLPGTFTITVSNVGVNPTAGNINITDVLPAGLTFVSGTGTGFSCSASGQVVSCVRTTVLPPGQSVAIALTVNVAARALPSIVNSVSVATPGDEVPGNNTAITPAIPVSPPPALTPDLGVSKQLIGSAVAGANATFRVTVKNMGTGPTTGPITVTDVLQSGLTFVRGTGTGWSCVASGQTVTCTQSGVLAPNASTTLDIVVSVARGLTTVTNSARVVTSDDPNDDNDTDVTPPVTVILPPDLTLTKTASGPFLVGQAGTYTLSVTNIGNGSTTGLITVTDVVPAGLNVVSATGAGWTCTIAGQTVTCSHPGPLAPNASLTVTISVMPTAAAIPAVTNTASVSTPDDGNAGNNDGSVTTTVGGVIDLALTKSGADSIVVGGRTSYTLTVRNLGTIPTTAPIVITDSLPSGLTFVSGGGPGFTCTAAGQVVTCTRAAPPLGAGQSVSVDLTVSVAPDLVAPVRNIACIRTASDTNTVNDCGTKTSAPTGEVDLVATKEVVGTLEIGQPGTFILTVRNTGNFAARPPITVVDTLPNGLSYVSATGTGWSCSAAGNVVTCTRTTALPPGAAPPITVTVNVAAAAFPRVTNCMTVRGTNETGPLTNNRSCVDAIVQGVGKLEIEKRVSRAEVQIGDVVDYTVLVKNTGNGAITDAIVTDQLPPGFLLESGSVRVNGVGGATVTGAPGPQVVIDVGRVNAGQQVTVTYRVRVGPGAQHGQNTNVAVASSRTRGGSTPPARAVVRITGGVFDERGAIVGKVFVQCDCEDGRMQDAGEVGIPGVRVFLEDGTSAVTDVEGKFNFYNVASRLHVVKVDRSTLPEGARLVPLVNRNAGDGYTRFADVKAGELHRADFADGSRDRAVLQRVLDRRRTGEVHNAGEPAVPVSAWERAGAMQASANRAAPVLMIDDSLVSVPPTSGGFVASTVAVPPQVRTNRYAPLFSGALLNENNSQLPVTPLRAQALQQGGNPSGRGSVEVRVGASLTGVPADGQTRVPVTLRLLDAMGNVRTGRSVVTLEASLGRWLGADMGDTEQGVQATLENGEGSFVLFAAPQPGVGEIRVTTPDASSTMQITFVPVNRPTMITGLLNARIDFKKLVRGGLGVSAGGESFEESLRDWSFAEDSGETRGGARAALLMKGTVLDDRLLTLSYDSERDRGRTFFRDISPNEFFPVYGDASMREFDAQSRRRFYARLDKGSGYTMYGDFQTTRSDDRRVLSSYDRSLTGGVQHLEGRDGSLTVFASQGRISQAVDELPGRGISGPYALSRATGLINSERVEIIVRDRNQPSVILSRSPMTRFADYTIEPVTGRILFRMPVQSLDANLNPISIRVTYETENGASKAFWIYGLDGSVRAGKHLELGGTFARDEGPTSSHQVLGLNATAKLGKGTTVFGEFARTENTAGTTGSAQRVELRHQSATFDGRFFAVRGDSGFFNQSSIFTGGRTEVGGRFSRQLAEGTRLVGEALHSSLNETDLRRQGVVLSIERQFSQAWRGEFGYRFARSNVTDVSPMSSGLPLVEDRDVSALRGRLQFNLPQQTRTSLFAEAEQDVRESDQRRLAVGGEYIIASRARLYGRHEYLSGLRDQFTPTQGQDRNITVFGVDADYFKNTQMFSEYRARDAFNGRDAEASIGLRNRWAIAPGLLVNTTFERVTPLFDPSISSRKGGEALALTGAVEWIKPARYKTTARLEFREAEQTGDNFLASFGYARKLSRDWTMLGRTLWDNFDAGQRQTRGFSQFGVAWRETDENKWNALARYEHRFERLGGSESATATRDQAHIVAAMLNYQPVQRFTLSSRYAAKRSLNRLSTLESSSAAQLLMARGVLDLTPRFDLGLIGSGLFSDGFSDRRYGLGGELGLIVMKNIRVAGGYNVFGFTDRDLNSFGTTRKGPYIELGFKFDESLFGLGDNSGGGRTAGRGGNR